MKIFQFLFVLVSLASLGQALAVRHLLGGTKDTKPTHSRLVAQDRIDTFVTLVHTTSGTGGEASNSGPNNLPSYVAGDSATSVDKGRLERRQFLAADDAADATIVEYVTETATEWITTQCLLSAKAEDQCQWAGTTTVTDVEPPTTITSHTTATETATRRRGSDSNKQPEVLRPSESVRTTTLPNLLPPTTITSSAMATESSSQSVAPSTEYGGTTTVTDILPPTTITSYTTAAEKTTKDHEPDKNKQAEQPPKTDLPNSAPETALTASIRTTTALSEPTVTSPPGTKSINQPAIHTVTSSGYSTVPCSKKRVSAMQELASKVLQQREMQRSCPAAPDSYGATPDKYGAGQVADSYPVTTVTRTTIVHASTSKPLQETTTTTQTTTAAVATITPTQTTTIAVVTVTPTQTTTIEVVTVTPTSQPSPSQPSPNESETKGDDTTRNAITPPKQDYASVQWIDDSSKTKNLFCSEDLKYHPFAGTSSMALVEDCQKLADKVKAKDGYYIAERWMSLEDWAVLTQFGTCHVAARKLSGDKDPFVEIGPRDIVLWLERAIEKTRSEGKAQDGKMVSVAGATTCMFNFSDIAYVVGPDSPL